MIQKSAYSQTIMVYLSISGEAINLVLVQEADREQKLVYFVIRKL